MLYKSLIFKILLFISLVIIIISTITLILVQNNQKEIIDKIRDYNLLQTTNTLNIREIIELKSDKNEIKNSISLIAKNISLYLYADDIDGLKRNILPDMKKDGIKAISIFDDVLDEIFVVAIKNNNEIIFKNKITEELNDYIIFRKSIYKTYNNIEEKIGIISLYYDESMIKNKISKIKDNTKNEIDNFNFIVDEELNKLNKTHFYLSFISLLIILLTISILLIKFVNKPLLILKKGIDEFFLFLQNKTDNIEKINLNTNDEFSNMANSLNENIVVSAKLHEEIYELNENLEARVEEKTKEQDVLLSLFDKGDAVLFKWNNDKNFTTNYVSLSVSNLLGYSKDEFIDKTITYSKCIYKDDLNRVLKGIKLANDKKEDFFKHESYRVVTKNKEIKWVIEYTVIIRDKDNKTTHFLGYIIDITKEKEKEKLLSEQSKLASMGEMIGNIAHQWRQPLSVISTAASSIDLNNEYGTLDNQELKEYCKAIDNSAQYLSKTIDDFRTFIKNDKDREIFNLQSNINSFLSLVNSTAESYKIDIIVDIDKDVEVYGYQNKLKECLINIFNNAKDVLEKNIEDDRLVFISAHTIKDKVEIKIKDNGNGIPEDILDKIFEPYFTTKHQSQGTGLGLYTTYNIVDSMDGKLDVSNVSYNYNNTTHKGAEFKISLPLKK